MKEVPRYIAGQTFRHTLLPEYKGNRSPTPDTVWDAVNFTKAALLSMGVQVVEVSNLRPFCKH